MKFLARLRRTFRSYDVRGTIERRLALIEDRVFDLRNRTDTSGRLELSALSISSQARHPGILYVPTRVRALRYFLNTCEFPPDSVFVDLGCGKGQVLLVASRFGFKRVVGVEYTRELCSIATANVRAYRKRHRNAVPIDVIEADAAEYEVKPDENVFYMYHPFGPDVVRQVVLNILSSAARHSRVVWIVYCHPMYTGVIESCADEAGSSGTFVRVRTFTYALKEFAVYTSRPVQAGQGASRRIAGLHPQTAGREERALAHKPSVWVIQAWEFAWDFRLGPGACPRFGVQDLGLEVSRSQRATVHELR